MKNLMTKLVAGFLILSTQQAFAQVNVDGYYRRDGTYVQPHHRTQPDNSLLNNYSTQGNVNPYTGQSGTVDPFNAPSHLPSTQNRSYSDPFYSRPPIPEQPSYSPYSSGSYGRKNQGRR